VWRGLETAPTANKTRIKSHSAMISLTLNYEGLKTIRSPIHLFSAEKLKESDYNKGVLRVL